MLCSLRDRLADVPFIHNVVTVVHRTSFMPHDSHGYRIRNPRTRQVTGGRAPEIVKAFTLCAFHRKPRCFACGPPGTGKPLHGLPISPEKHPR